MGADMLEIETYETYDCMNDPSRLALYHCIQGYRVGHGPQTFGDRWRSETSRECPKYIQTTPREEFMYILSSKS